MGQFLKLVNGRPKLFSEAASVTIYDETLAVGSTITTGTAVTLPASGTYNSEELEITLNGQRLDSVADYNYVGVAPRTQASFTFDLENGDSLRFRVDRSA